MSSSTMIHGATAWRPSAERIRAETTTSAVSQPQIGTARAYERAVSRRPLAVVALVAAKADLLQARGDLGRIVEADLGRGPGDFVDDCARDRRPAGELLERGGVRLGDAVDTVLALDEVEGGGAHRGADVRV